MLTQVKTSEPVVALSTRITLRVLFVIRAAYCGYGIAVVLMNANRYARPATALAAIALVVSVSLLLGIVISGRRAIPLAVCAADACTAVLALILLALALTPNERTGSLNWALASCVGCAVWLAFGEEWLVRLVLSISLGVAYLASVLAGADLGVGGLAIVAANFVSAPLFYGVALVVMKLVRRIAEQTDAARAIERRLHGEAAALREQERLFRELHYPSLDALEMIADISAHELAAKGRARTAARSLRRSLSGKVRSASQPGLCSRLDALTDEWLQGGCGVELIDEELDEEPPSQSADAICAALNDVMGSSLGRGGASSATIRVRSAPTAIEVVVRILSTEDTAWLLPPSAAARLAEVHGELSLSPRLGGERRFVMRVPV